MASASTSGLESTAPVNRPGQIQGGWQKEAIIGIVGAIVTTILAIMVPLVRSWWRRRMSMLVERNRSSESTDRGDEKQGNELGQVVDSGVTSGSNGSTVFGFSEDVDPYAEDSNWEDVLRMRNIVPSQT